MSTLKPSFPVPPSLPAALQQSRLRLLSVAGCPGVTDEGVAKIAESFAPSLTELDISGTSATERGLVLLAAAGGGGVRLQKITLPAHGRGVSALGIGALVSVRTLTWLDLEGCDGLGVTSLALAGACLYVYAAWSPRILLGLYIVC